MLLQICGEFVGGQEETNLQLTLPTGLIKFHLCGGPSSLVIHLKEDNVVEPTENYLMVISDFKNSKTQQYANREQHP